MQRIYMPHAGHFIGSDSCQFHLSTYLSTDYLVSTVGEYRPSFSRRHLDELVKTGKHEPLRARTDDEGFEELGLGTPERPALYETMVFRAKPSDSKCCPWRMADAKDLDFKRYSTADEAAEGHEAMCKKWERLQVRGALFVKPDLKEIVKRAEAATPAPWAPLCDYEESLRFLCNDKDYGTIIGSDNRTLFDFSVQRTDAERENMPINPKDKAQVVANVTFVVHAREDVPALCKRVAELEDALRWAMRGNTKPSRIPGQNDDYYDRWHRANALLNEERG